MEEIAPLVQNTNKKIITFPDEYFKSNDGKTIMGEVAFKDILFLAYRETEAGSNPREYAGLKKTTNINILQSLLKDSEYMFRFLHSGIIVSVTNPTYLNSNIVKYEDCCLTNGNQTRFIILILFLLKVSSFNGELKELKNKEYNQLCKTHFQDNNNILDILKMMRLTKINGVIKYLQGNQKYKNAFWEMELNNFLETKIRIQMNVINAIIEDIDGELDTYQAGTLIAEANNDTQSVRVDDLFGNKNKKELKDKIFCNFNNFYGNEIVIEFRFGEVEAGIKKVHILTLLRPVIATGILTKENDIFKLTNQRQPIYKLFEKLLNKKPPANELISSIAKMIPLLYKIRMKYIEPYLKEHKRTFFRDYKEKAFSGGLADTIIAEEVAKYKTNEKELDKLIKRNTGCNIEHIFPVVVFKIKKLFRENESGDIELTLSEENWPKFFEGLTKAIYQRYIEMKLAGLPSSLTTELRKRSFYQFGDEAYITFESIYRFGETDYIAKTKHVIS